MRTLLSAIVAYVSAFVTSRHQLAMEVVALRQQLAVYKRKRRHPKLRRSDRLFWVAVRQMWDYWSSALILVRYRRRLASGRLPVVLEMALTAAASREAERGRRSPTVDPPHEKGKSKLGRASHPGELQLLGFDISEPTVSRYLRQLRLRPEKSKAGQWLAFLNKFIAKPSLRSTSSLCPIFISHFVLLLGY